MYGRGDRKSGLRNRSYLLFERSSFSVEVVGTLNLNWRDRSRVEGRKEGRGEDWKLARQWRRRRRRLTAALFDKGREVEREREGGRRKHTATSREASCDCIGA